MIYEIFAAAAEGGLGRGEFAVSVLAALYIIYLSLYTLGYTVRKAWDYIDDCDNPIQNFMTTMWKNIFVTKTEKKIVTEENYREFNGWFDVRKFRSHSTWRFEQYKDGRREDFCDTEGELKIYMRRSGAPLLNIGDRVSIEKQRYDLSDDGKALVVCTAPAMLAGAFLFLDTFPVAAVSLATLYMVMRLARTAVRLGKKLNKHINNPDAHKEVDKAE